MDDVRKRIKSTEPELDIELSQILQDNINDLSNAPEPIQIKIYSEDPALLSKLGPEVGDAIAKIDGVTDVENGIDNTISGPATNFQVDPVVAARLGFTPQEVSEDATAILDGIETNNPMIANGRPYNIRVRLGDEHRASLDAIRNTVFNSASGHTATLGSMADIQQLPPQNEILRENLQRMITVTGDLEGSDLGGTMAKVAPGRRRPAPASFGPRRVRRHLPGAAEIVPRSAHRPHARPGAGLRRAAHRVPQLPRAHRHPHLVGALHLRRDPGAAGHAAPPSTWPRSWASSWSSASWPRTASSCSMPTSASAPRAHPPTDAMLHAAQRRLRPIVMTAIAAICGMLPLAFAIGAGSQMLQPLAIAVIGGLTISMFLSLVVTPLVYYWLTRNREVQPA